MPGIAYQRNGLLLLRRVSFFFGIIFIIMSSSFLGIGLTTPLAAYALIRDGSHLTSTCPAAAGPTSNSLLVVLLDRSGSLIVEPGATDPNRYSTSVTKSLADLWPGKMAVVPFSNSATPILGPANLLDPAAKANLKNSIDSYPIGGGTPLGPAMHQALTLLQGAAPGSRVIVVTDGQPTGNGNNDGQHQEDDIRNNLINQFCTQGIPVSVFGLTIDPNTSGGQDAVSLLTAIADGTNALYTPVSKPEDLAKAVIQLYAQWRHLSFREASVQNGNAPFPVDSSAKEVTILTFRSNNTTPVILDGPNGQPIQGTEIAEDKHYAIDQLTSGSGVFVPGTYTIHTSGDNDVQVYELVDSTLQIQIITPTMEQKVPNNKPVAIEAKFVDNGNDKQPAPGEATMVAIVRFIVNGKQVSSVQIPLIQHGAIFKGQTQTYSQNGSIQIEVDGNDQGVQRSTGSDVQLVPPPPPPCKLGFFGCLLQQLQQFWQQHSTQIVGFGLAGLLLLLLLFWLTRQSPFGGLKRDPRAEPIPLGQGRTLGRKLFKKSVISSSELETDFPDFVGVNFDLVFHRGRNVTFKYNSGDAPIKIFNGRSFQEVQPGNKDDVPLLDGSVINIRGRNAAIFTEN